MSLKQSLNTNLGVEVKQNPASVRKSIASLTAEIQSNNTSMLRGKMWFPASLCTTLLSMKNLGEILTISQKHKGSCHVGFLMTP